jgi:acyl-CoA synthetase (AMP-forming)/AMP-acid ligase II
VAPPEREAVLLGEKEKIIDVAVTGVKFKPNSDSESPRAYVVRRPGTNMTEEEVKKLISDKLASYKQLTGGVVFLNEIPKSPSGKILKRVLREQAQNEIDARAKL